MGILNYTTEIAVETTILDIEKILAKGGADKILKEYDGAGNILAVSFMVKTEQGNLPFKISKQKNIEVRKAEEKGLFQENSIMI